MRTAAPHAFAGPAAMDTYLERGAELTSVATGLALAARQRFGD
jgi:hypothetical protein